MGDASEMRELKKRRIQECREGEDEMSSDQEVICLDERERWYEVGESR